MSDLAQLPLRELLSVIENQSKLYGDANIVIRAERLVQARLLACAPSLLDVLEAAENLAAVVRPTPDDGGEQEASEMVLQTLALIQRAIAQVNGAKG